MPNHWFEFKQFKIHQDKTAMKVGTDGVLIGAWTELPSTGKVLDIGTGTGLLALMVAQRNSELVIHAIEIDESATVQALQNVKESKWTDRISVEHISFQEYVSSTNKRFDLIITNPPFFNSGVKAIETERSIARHADALPPEALIEGVKKLLKPEGTFAVILPTDAYEKLSSAAIHAGFFECRKLLVYPNLKKQVIRILSQWTKKEHKEPEISELVIEPWGRHQYSDEYKALTRAFYLKI